MEPALDGPGRDLLFTEAHTAYTFADTPLSEGVLDDIWELIRNAPTSFNSQPLRMVEVASADARERLNGLLIPSNRPKTRAAPLTVILAADTRFDRLLDEVFPALPGAARFFADPETRRRTALMNASIQVGYFLIGVRALGLAAGPMAGVDRDGVDRTFFAGGSLRSLLVVNIGHPGPDAFFPRSPRLPAAQVVSRI